MWFKHAMALTLACSLAAACGDDAPPVGQDAGVDGPLTQPDSRSDGVQQTDTLLPDSAADQGADSFSSDSALQAVLNSLTLPNSPGQYAKDLDGDNVADNQLAVLMGALNFLNFDMQGELDASLAAGDVLILLDLVADSLSDAVAAQLNGYLGEDLDDPENPADNFSGSEPFGVNTAVPEMLLPGTILAGRLNAGPGNFVIPLPMLGAVSLQQTQISADVSAAGMANGQINGAIPWSEMEAVVLPNMGMMLTELLNDPDADQNMRNLIASQFDSNQDGTITADEIQANALISLFLKADVDLDGDGTKDAMSLGLGFTAVPAVIQF